LPLRESLASPRRLHSAADRWMITRRGTEVEMRAYALLVGIAVSTAALSVGVATATAGGGNSANAHLCQKGGWTKLQGSDGRQFANQGACVSYGAHGGTIVPIQPTVSISYTPTSDPNFCNVKVTLSHFAPNTQYQVFGLGT